MTHKIFEMPVADVYVHYVNKVERKERTEDELVKGWPMEKILRSGL